MPVAIPGVNYLSGGQSLADACARLSAINRIYTSKGSGPTSLIHNNRSCSVGYCHTIECCVALSVLFINTNPYTNESQVNYGVSLAFLPTTHLTLLDHTLSNLSLHIVDDTIQTHL